MTSNKSEKREAGEVRYSRSFRRELIAAGRGGPREEEAGRSPPYTGNFAIAGLKDTARHGLRKSNEIPRKVPQLIFGDLDQD